MSSDNEEGTRQRAHKKGLRMLARFDSMFRLMQPKDNAPKKMSNAEYAATSELFRESCRLAGLPPTARQASKFRRDKGQAFGYAPEARRQLAEKREAAQA